MEKELIIFFRKSKIILYVALSAYGSMFLAGAETMTQTSRAEIADKENESLRQDLYTHIDPKFRDTFIAVEKDKNPQGSCNSNSSTPCTSAFVTTPPGGIPVPGTPPSDPSGANPSLGANGSLVTYGQITNGAAAGLSTTLDNAGNLRTDTGAYGLKYIQAAQNSVTAASQKTQNSPSDQAAILHDMNIVNRAAFNFQNDKPISKSEADSALIPDVRDSLQKVYRAQSLDQYLAAKQKQLTSDIEALLAVSATALERAQGLATATGNNSGPLQASSPPASRTPSSIAVASHDAQLGSPDPSAAAKTAGDSSASAAATAGADKVAQALASMKPVQGNAVRERLRKKLLATRAAEAAKEAALKAGASSDPFAGKLTIPGAASETDSPTGDTASLAAQAVSSALQSSAAAEQQRFSLAGPETDAAVRKLMRDPAQEMASADASLQGENSPSLFDRVRSAHKHCLQQKCVQSN